MEPLTPTEDIRAARHRLAAKFNNDLKRIVADLRRQELESGAEFVILERRTPITAKNHGLHSSSGEFFGNDGLSPSAR
jgi:hypothetical protein